ncbi:MAG: hypothetical protein P8Z00_19275 [Anaerolineales bacterium]
MDQLLGRKSFPIRDVQGQMVSVHNRLDGITKDYQFVDSNSALCGRYSPLISILLIMGRKKAQDFCLNEGESYRVFSTETLPTGHCIVSAEVIIDEEGKVGMGGMVTLRVGEKVIGEGRFDRQVHFPSAGSSMEVESLVGDPGFRKKEHRVQACFQAGKDNTIVSLNEPPG